MLAAPAVVLMIFSTWVLIRGSAGQGGFVAYVGDITRMISLFTLVGGALVLLIAIGIARHIRDAEVLGVWVCAATTALSLWFRPMPGEWPVAAGISAGATAIVLLVALRQKPNPRGLDGPPPV